MPYTEDEFEIIKNARWRIITFLKCVGLFPMMENLMLYQILQYFVIFVMSTVLFGCINFTYENRHNIFIVSKACPLIFGLSTVLLKIISYSIYREELLQLDELLNEFIVEHMKDDNLSKVMLVPILFYAKKLLIKIIICAWAVSLSMYSQPLMFMIRQYINDVEEKIYILPYPTIFPYKIEGGSLLWALHWIWETICGIVFASVGAFTDNAFGFYATNIVAQFRVLSYEIKNMIFSNDNDDDNRKLQTHIVTKHLKLIQCCQLLQKINGPIVLAMSITTALILCCLTFQISQMKTITPGQIAWIVIYIWYKLLQAFLFAWAGEEVIIASESFRDSVYASKWGSCEKKSIKNFITMLLLQRPMVLNACGIAAISAQMFSKIINTSLSYFFLLQTLDQE